MTLYTKAPNLIKPPFEYWRQDIKTLHLIHAGYEYAFTCAGAQVPTDDRRIFKRMVISLALRAKPDKLRPEPHQCFIAGVRSATCSFVPVKPFSWVREA